MAYTKETAMIKVANSLGMGVEDITPDPVILRHLRDIIATERNEYHMRATDAISNKIDGFIVRRLLRKEMEASEILDAINTLLQEN